MQNQWDLHQTAPLKMRQFHFQQLLMLESLKLHITKQMGETSKSQMGKINSLMLRD
jgi:hypothetical protein